jgi:hypothetical protein
MGFDWVNWFEQVDGGRLHLISVINGSSKNQQNVNQTYPTTGRLLLMLYAIKHT